MSRTYRRSKEDDVFAKKMIDRRWALVRGDDAVHEVNPSQEIDTEKYLVRTLVYKDGMRRKFVHLKETVTFCPFFGYCDQTYDSSAFKDFQDGRGFSAPKYFRKILEDSYKQKTKNEMRKWINDNTHDVVIEPIKKFANAKWLYF